MQRPFMPKAVAIWLLKNTKLTHQQIADFCKLYIHDVSNLVENKTILGKNPVECGYLSQKQIEECEEDENQSLLMSHENLINSDKTKKYIHLNRKNKKPNCIVWVAKHYPEAKNSQIASLIGTTTATVKKNRDNTSSIKEEHPVAAGLCTQEEFDHFVQNHANDASDNTHDPFDLL